MIVIEINKWILILLLLLGVGGLYALDWHIKKTMRSVADEITEKQLVKVEMKAREIEHRVHSKLNEAVKNCIKDPAIKKELSIMIQKDVMVGVEQGINKSLGPFKRLFPGVFKRRK